MTERRLSRALAAVGLLAAIAPPVRAQGAPGADPGPRAGLDAIVSRHPATGAVRFVRRTSPEADLAAGTSETSLPARRRFEAFLARHGELFGVDASTVLDRVAETTDELGFRHLRLAQFHRGVPVFGGGLAAHFDRAGRLAAVHGTVLGALELEVVPRIDAGRAIERARSFAIGERGERGERARPGAALSTGTPRLWILRRELGRGRPYAAAGSTHLAWGVEVRDGGDFAVQVFVDAGLGKVVEHWTLAPDALERRAYSGLDQAPFDGIPDSWPDSPDWVEGDPAPTGVLELDGALEPTAQVHAFFAALGRDSWDGEGHVLDLSWNRASFCPNASWNGLLASFCAGFAVHDVVAHEWAHAYTQTTHGLIYLWQSGALNESYSDIWGEALDQAVELGSVPDTDEPRLRRPDGVCSGFVPARLRVSAPSSVEGTYAVATASFGSAPGLAPTVRMRWAADGAGDDPLDACEPIPGALLVGRLAFANRGACSFETQARHAQQAGAIGVVIGNRATDPEPEVPPAMGCDPVLACDLSITIPAVSLAAADADALRAVLTSDLRAAVEAGDNQGAKDSVRWLLGEDVRPFGVARDMWDPTCRGNPGRIQDPEYYCGTGDGGGVHLNSGVSNHAFALLVDGGDYNGRTVTGVGLARAAHVYWRAQSVYQTPITDFADHADALEAACADLVGAPLPDPFGGPPVTLAAVDCQQLASALAAVEMRSDPPCDFEPILDPDAPPICGTQHAYPFSVSPFEAGADGWTISRRDVANPDMFDDRDWTRVGDLPDDRPGTAFFAPDPMVGDCVTDVPGDDDSGVLVLESPELVIPVGRPARLVFDHHITTETTWDGGNVKLRLGGGAWTLLPATAFVFNDYPGALRDPQSNDNPMAGEEAFHGVDEGSNSGSWGRSIVDLSGFVAAGQPFRLRFEFGTDRCFGSPLGWFVDDVTLAACVPHPPIFLDGLETGDASRWSISVEG